MALECCRSTGRDNETFSDEVRIPVGDGRQVAVRGNLLPDTDTANGYVH